MRIRELATRTGRSVTAITNLIHGKKLQAIKEPADPITGFRPWDVTTPVEDAIKIINENIGRARVISVRRTRRAGGRLRIPGGTLLRARVGGRTVRYEGPENGAETKHRVSYVMTSENLIRRYPVDPYLPLDAEQRATLAEKKLERAERGHRDDIRRLEEQLRELKARVG